jgi:photosystem II stability/assembly factor-like uncharacterized protein
MKLTQSTILILLFAALSSTASAQTYGWVDWSARIPEQVGLTDVHFVGNEGWITGGNSKLYHTTDGGQTFTIQTLPSPAGISNSVFIRSLTEGYTVTSTGGVFYASNPVSGNWTLISGALGVALFSIHFPPSGTGYACGNSGEIYSVTSSSVGLDATIGSATFTSIVFPASTQGWVCGGATIRHKNGTWLADQFYAANSYNSIYFVDNSNGWAGGGNGVIIHTIDGIHWNGQSSPTSNLLMDVFFLNYQEGWAIGNSVLLHTTDGGGTPDGHWQIEGQSVASGKLLRAVFAVDNHAVYVVGNNTFLKYTQVTGVDGEQDAPASFALQQNYPNPVNPATRIEYAIPKASHVSLKVFDLLGREVTTLVDEVQDAGFKTVTFNASGLASGVYFYRLKAGSFVQTMKLILLR